MINGTLIVQGLHFMCGYLILKYILFKPGLAVLSAKTQRTSTLRKSIVQLEKQTTQRRQEQEAAWQKCVDRMNERKPRLVSPSLLDKTVITEEPVGVSMDEREVIEKIKDKIISFVERRRDD